MFEFTEITQYVVSVLGSILLAVLSFAVNRFADKLGLERDSKIREVVDDAIYNAINYAQQRVYERSEKWTVETEKDALADIVNYIMNHIPEALAHFGVDRESLVELVEARLNHYEYDEEDNG